MQKRDQLTNNDHDKMDAFIGAIIDDYKNGLVSKQAIIAGLGHVIGAIDQGCHDEARRWFSEGRKKIHENRND